MKMRKIVFAAVAVALAAVPALAQVALYDSGSITAVGAGTGGSHAAGSAVGNLFAVPVARSQSSSGRITSFMITDQSAATGQLIVRIYQAKPTNTTCTDGSAFAGNAADNAQLISAPFAVTPVKPGVLTGDTNSYAGITNAVLDYDQSDSIGTNGVPANQNLYVCLQTVTTENITPANLTVMLAGPQNR